ncbi:MAG: BPL-N domain-containing protein [Candidatus Thorarchaeota archaeon]
MSSLKKSIRSRRAILATCILLFFILTSIPNAYSASQELPSTLSDLSDTKVAIFGGVGVLDSSKDALESMFLWANASVDIVYAFQILNGTLDSYDIVVFPGGSAVSYSQGLGTEGLDVIREFVRNGGSYFGICGGSLFATNAVLGLFNGSYSNSINGTGIFLTEMYVNQNSTGPDLSDEPESYWTMYWGSSYFYGEMDNIIPICSYSLNDRPGMIAFSSGAGTVFLSSPHPEYEEGDSRDGTIFSDYLNDPDTEWNLMLKVSRWLVDESTTTPLPSQNGLRISPYVIAGTIAVIGLMSIVFLVKIRKT